MAKGKPNLNWKKQVIEWQQSNKSPKTWSKEKKIPYTTFLGWKNRFEKSNEVPEKFIELKDTLSQDSGIVLDCNGIKIHLKNDFDQIALRNCLNCLRGISC